MNAIIREYRRGASTYELATWHHVRRNTVRDVLRRNGVQIAANNVPKLSPEQKDAIHLKRAGGATMRMLCGEFEVSESTIKRALREHGRLEQPVPIPLDGLPRKSLSTEIETS